MKKGARIKDIAEALNISITTVSRALNDKEDISEIDFLIKDYILK